MSKANKSWVKSVRLEDGSPWSAVILASCVTSMATDPKVEVYILYQDRTTNKAGTVGLGLLSRGWEALLQDLASGAVTYLHTRDVKVPDAFCEVLRQVLVEARTVAILAVVRHQAASLIHEIPAAEACRVWAEEEARRTLDL